MPGTSELPLNIVQEKSRLIDGWDPVRVGSQITVRRLADSITIQAVSMQEGRRLADSITIQAVFMQERRRRRLADRITIQAASM